MYSVVHWGVVIPTNFVEVYLVVPYLLIMQIAKLELLNASGPFSAVDNSIENFESSLGVDSKSILFD